MAEPALLVTKTLLQNCLNWFQGDFRQSVVALIESQFSSYALPAEIQSVLERWQRIREIVDAAPAQQVDIIGLLPAGIAPASDTTALFKQIILRYRRHWAARTESMREKTFHLNLIQTVEEEINILDALVKTDWFQQLESVRLPRAKDYLPVQFIEQAAFGQIELTSRQYDEKFHILQAPTLFLQDLAYFRSKCELREAPLAVAYMDIDDFKKFNTAHTETKVDRNLLPRFMQAIEGYVYQHGFAYREGGDEYLILLPSLSSALCVAFLDGLRRRLADLSYPDIPEHTTVSIGLCIAEPDCPLTDRELKARANDAKKFAKDHGKNCIATYAGLRFVADELKVVSP